jgi:hypothetical protein
MMRFSKSARVKLIKDNIQKGDKVPFTDKDCDVGRFIDYAMAQKGHKIDKNGIVDLPEFGIDNKTKELNSKSAHTQGSMTIKDIIRTSEWTQTRFYKKTLNQNQITWNKDFQEVTDVTILDMDLPEVQSRLETAYKDLRDQLIENDKNDIRKKNIISRCGWAVFDGYGHDRSYRFRIPYTVMKKIKTLSKSRDTRNKLFEQVD